MIRNKIEPVSHVSAKMLILSIIRITDNDRSLARLGFHGSLAMGVMKLAVIIVE